jgi:hypothetical protein
MATLTVLDNMEYGSDVTAQSNYISNGFPPYNAYSSDTYTKLLIHFDESNASFTDASGNNTLTNSGVTYSSTGRFGGAGSFSEAYLHTPYNSALNPGTGDFTIECLAKFTTLNQYNTLIGQNSEGGMIVHLYSNGTLCLGKANGGYQSNCSLNTNILIDGNYHHIAISRVSGTVYMFLDGIKQTVSGASNTTDYFFVNNVSLPICVGSQNGANYWGVGTMDEFRLSIGVGRWSDDFTSICSYKESSIISEGSYSLKAVAAQTTSLNKTLTRTITSPINLTGYNYIIGKIRSTRTGSNIKLGFHDTTGITTEITPNITATDTWQNFQLDISSVSGANKDAIDQIVITVVNADYDNTFYLDMLWAFSGLSEPLIYETVPKNIFIPFRGNSRFLNYEI